MLHWNRIQIPTYCYIYPAVAASAISSQRVGSKVFPSRVRWLSQQRFSWARWQGDQTRSHCWSPPRSPPEQLAAGGVEHDDVIAWQRFLHYWPYVWGIHRDRWIPHTKGQQYGGLVFSSINCRINIGVCADLSRHGRCWVIPADTRRDNTVIITSKRRRAVVFT